jgi:hypothetical protein
MVDDIVLLSPNAENEVKKIHDENTRRRCLHENAVLQLRLSLDEENAPLPRMFDLQGMPN